MENTTLLIQLEETRQDIINYLLAKVRCCDWHAVSDAANDLREIEAKLLVLKQ